MIFTWHWGPTRIGPIHLCEDHSNQLLTQKGKRNRWISHRSVLAIEEKRKERASCTVIVSWQIRKVHITLLSVISNQLSCLLFRTITDQWMTMWVYVCVLNSKGAKNKTTEHDSKQRTFFFPEKKEEFFLWSWNPIIEFM